MYEIFTTKENRDKVRKAIMNYGTVTDCWSDGSFNFEPYSTQAEDKLIEILDDLHIEYEFH